MSDSKLTAATLQPPGEDTQEEGGARISREESVDDLDLIRWSLSLSAEERLDVLQDFVDTFWTPRHG